MSPIASLDYLVAPVSQPRWLVACLCAQWCGTCRDYRAPLTTLASAMPEHAFIWIDIEDNADLAGDLDVETFPTMLILAGREILFHGPVLPDAESLRRLLRALADNGAQPLAVDAATRALADRLEAARRAGASDG